MTTSTETFNITIGGYTEGHLLVKTNCPKAYDYGYTIEIYGEDREERFVLVPDRSIDYQMGRYLSGGYASVEELNSNVADWICETLVARIRG